MPPFQEPIHKSSSHIDRRLENQDLSGFKGLQVACGSRGGAGQCVEVSLCKTPHPDCSRRASNLPVTIQPALPPEPHAARCISWGLLSQAEESPDGEQGVRRVNTVSSWRPVGLRDGTGSTAALISSSLPQQRAGLTDATGEPYRRHWAFRRALLASKQNAK